MPGSAQNHPRSAQNHSRSAHAHGKPTTTPPSLSRLSLNQRTRTAFVGVRDVKSKRILVVRATTNGKWMLPGGLLENYEISTPWLGAARELKEESGFTISLGPAHLNSRNGDCYLYEHWFDFDGPNMNRHSIFASRPETKDKRPKTTIKN